MASAPSAGVAAAGSSTIGARLPSKSKSSAVAAGSRRTRSRRSSGVTGCEATAGPPGARSGLWHTAAVDRRLRAVAAAGMLLALAGCREHTVLIRFDPEVGDRWELTSRIDTQLERTVDSDTSVERSSSRLEGTESVVDVDGDDVDVEVSVARDGEDPQTFEVRFDRTGRLSAIDLVEGLPADALGASLASGLPADLISPPTTRLAPGERWEVDRRVRLDGRTGPVRIEGTGRVESLGVEDGRDVAVAVVEVVVPVRSVIETAAGRVTLVGSQTITTRTAYDLTDGTARRERTQIDGTTELIFEPPPGEEAPPIPGSLRYEIRTETTRLPVPPR